MPAIVVVDDRAADPVAALQHDDVVAEPDQVPGRRQPCEPGTHDDDVGIGWDGHATRLSRREGDDSAVRTHDAIERAHALREAGASGVFTFEGPHDVFTPLTLASTVGGLDLMTNVAIAFPRNPIHLAHQAIDHQLLSEGPLHARPWHAGPRRRSRSGSARTSTGRWRG